MRKIPKPLEGEFPPYATMYMKLVPDDGLLLDHLKENFKIIKQLALSLSQEELNYRYEPGK